MQGNPISIITKTDQHQTEDITFPQVKREFVSSVQTGVEFCAIEKPSCVVDGHFITYHRRLRPTAFSLDNLRKTAIRIKIIEIKVCPLDTNRKHLDACVIVFRSYRICRFPSVTWKWTGCSFCRLAVLQMQNLKMAVL